MDVSNVPGASKRLKVAVSGASGMVGRALVSRLLSQGHTVERLVRGQPRPAEGEIAWDPVAGSIDSKRLEGVDAVVNLAGESIAGGRWTAAKKERILASRAHGTRFLSAALASLDRPPAVLASASAIGFYGDRGDASLDESAAPGSDFLADVCREWEGATEPAGQRGIRVAHLRLGVVLSTTGGALATMLIPFKLGVGGVMGSGKQFMSWIALDDAVLAIEHVLATESLRGPVNLVTPNAVTNRQFTKTLGKVLGRPTILPMPAAAARLAFGEMADALFLGSARVVPQRLVESGYTFRYPELEAALRHLLGKE